MSSNKNRTAAKPAAAAQQQTGATPQAASRPPARPSRPSGSSQRTTTANADPEGQAILTCLEALRGLTQPNARQRVMNYVATRYNLRIAGMPGQTEGQSGTETEPGIETVTNTEGAQTLGAAG